MRISDWSADVCSSDLTSAVGDEGGGLLGDSGFDFVLAGTSFSRNATNVTNFAGFLSQHLSAEVLNYAVTGGGNDAAMLQYLASDDFAESKPKFLIWEFLYHDLPSEGTFRQILGTLRGDFGKQALNEPIPGIGRAGGRERVGE